LRADHIFDDLKLLGGARVWLRPDGTVRVGIIYDPHRINGVTYEPGAIQFDEKGEVWEHAGGVFEVDV
jgi:hypothetical protein